jgi:polyprenyl-phospho-N-acetylgalactosaminyl synthase
MGVIVLRHLINVGQGGSLRTGFEYALKTKNEFIATIDADGQHRIDDLLKMYAFMKEHRNVDILLGSRFLEGGNAFNIPKHRKLLLKSATYVSRLLHGISISDIYNGLRIFRKQSLTSLKLKTYGTAHASEILHEISRQHFMYREFPVNIYYTDYSIKKGLTTLNSLRIIYEYFILRRI